MARYSIAYAVDTRDPAVNKEVALDLDVLFGKVNISGQRADLFIGVLLIVFLVGRA